MESEKKETDPRDNKSYARKMYICFSSIIINDDLKNT